MAGQKRTVAKKSLAARNTAKTSRSSRASQSTKTTTPVMSSTSTKSYLKNPRLWVGVGVVVLALVLYFYKGLFIAAMVNGQPISRLAVIHSLEQQNGKQALGNLIVQNLVLQEAQKRNVTVGQSEIDAEVAKIEATLKGQGVTLADALAARGLTRADLDEQIKLQKLLDKMVGSSVKVTDDDVNAYIDKNRDSLPQDLSDADLQKQVRTQLEQDAVQSKTQAFVADLQKKAKVTYFVGY